MNKQDILLLAAALISLTATACRVDPDKFQSRVFHCDTAAPDPLCGTDGDGAPMQCFAARQMGGSDFCTQTCAATPMSLPEEGAVCVQGANKLRACNPADDADAAQHPLGACDRREFGCLSTDVLSDEGICVTMNPCGEDADCRDPVRSTCAATFLQRLYRGSPALKADHLYCLQEGCQASRTACSPGETCLRDVIPADGNPPDICVPNCDSKLQCPPNHFCYRKISGPATPAVCIPGLLGFVCETDVDCLVGTCRDDGENHGHKLCTTPCNSDEDCQQFDSEQGLFVCNRHKQCATPSAYRGATCDTDADCIRNPDATRCVRFSPADQLGTCLYPCRVDATCPAFGGINHTCLDIEAQTPKDLPVCFPGFFKMPCLDTAQCVGDLSCRGADPATQTYGICTALCQTDDDCAQNRWTTGQSFCGAAEGTPVCLPLGEIGDPCTSNTQCASKNCVGTGAKTCAVKGVGR